MQVTACLSLWLFCSLSATSVGTPSRPRRPRTVLSPACGHDCASFPATADFASAAGCAAAAHTTMLKRPAPLLSLLAALTCSPAPAATTAAPPIHWHTQWSESLFAQAAREHRFVLLDLHAVWCHWCHVMDEKTYADHTVVALIDQRYLPVSIDADSDPALTSRYGDWGWPATIVLAADGTEIVKRRGFIPAAQMATLLQAIIDDPTPGPRARRGPSSQYPRRGSHARTTDCTPEALRGSLRFRARRLGHGPQVPRCPDTRVHVQ